MSARQVNQPELISSQWNAAGGILFKVAGRAGKGLKLLLPCWNVAILDTCLPNLGAFHPTKATLLKKRLPTRIATFPGVIGAFLIGILQTDNVSLFSSLCFRLSADLPRACLCRAEETFDSSSGSIWIAHAVPYWAGCKRKGLYSMSSQSKSLFNVEKSIHWQVIFSFCFVCVFLPVNRDVWDFFLYRNLK